VTADAPSGKHVPQTAREIRSPGRLAAKAKGGRGDLFETVSGLGGDGVIATTRSRVHRTAAVGALTPAGNSDLWVPLAIRIIR
jgi:hypothetical protein